MTFGVGKRGPRGLDRRYSFDHETFRRAVLDALAESRLSKSTMATELGYSPTSMSQMINGVEGRGTGAHPIIAICAYLGINPCDFVVDTEDATPESPIPKTYRAAVARIRELEQSLAQKVIPNEDRNV